MKDSCQERCIIDEDGLKSSCCCVVVFSFDHVVLLRIHVLENLPSLADATLRDEKNSSVVQTNSHRELPPTLYFSSRPTILFMGVDFLLAPFLAGGFYYGTPRRLIVTWVLILFIAFCIVGLKRLGHENYFRKDVGVGLFVGLGMGGISILWYAGVACCVVLSGGKRPPLGAGKKRPKGCVDEAGLSGAKHEDVLTKEDQVVCSEALSQERNGERMRREYPRVLWREGWVRRDLERMHGGFEGVMDSQFTSERV